jgi:hypothetical protein
MKKKRLFKLTVFWRFKGVAPASGSLLHHVVVDV